ncbi:hypothetical protein DPMN_174942 [Dreissena polymorpha]|uniref:CPC1/SPEF2 domain-containing protein n=1 Tax=Dreissena polymorpha TaxID=45954 RepID=A0A9D4E845_DREPO|nr:hypothetical protein DPMN_174942 [Dreissena polymorpha]
MRQSQQERRIAVQLLQTRHEKEVIRSNRIQREQMYEERRRKDFEDAMNRESVRRQSVDSLESSIWAACVRKSKNIVLIIFFNTDIKK